jgi:hypothetical protein
MPKGLLLRFRFFTLPLEKIFNLSPFLNCQEGLSGTFVIYMTNKKALRNLFLVCSENLG